VSAIEVSTTAAAVAADQQNYAAGVSTKAKREAQANST
jgi:hypothetical protein